jgi:hypothetical protein
MAVVTRRASTEIFIFYFGKTRQSGDEKKKKNLATSKKAF